MVRQRDSYKEAEMQAGRDFIQMKGNLHNTQEVETEKPNIHLEMQKRGWVPVLCICVKSHGHQVCGKEQEEAPVVGAFKKTTYSRKVLALRRLD